MNEQLVNGARVRYLDGAVVSIDFGWKKFELGQEVESNGRAADLPPKGTRGVVVRLWEPNTPETSRPIDILFEGYIFTWHMKVKDLL